MLREKFDPGEDELQWSERAEYWRTFEPQPTRGRPKKFNYRQPLILCGNGVRIRIDHGSLLIHNGFSHYPQKQEVIRLFPGDADLPDRIVILDGSGGISFDALGWMVEQQITLVQLDWRGNVSFVVGGNSGYSGNKKLIDRQLAITTSQKVKITRSLIADKISASINTLSAAISESEIRNNSILALKNWISRIKNPRNSNSLGKILGIEGAAAAAYFQGWQGIPLNWRGHKRHAIPDSWRKIAPRTMTWRRGHQNARHPINAMLNYGYGILVSQLRTQVVAAGLDPGIGIMHGTATNRIPLVYDLMEPLRPLVDQKVLEFALARTFSAGDFTINRYGGCRLNPELAKSLIRQIEINRPGEVAKLILGNL